MMSGGRLLTNEINVTLDSFACVADRQCRQASEKSSSIGAKSLRLLPKP